MKSSLLTKPLAAIVLASSMIVYSGANAPAAPAPAPPATELLRQAYASLAVADRDYKGHRVEAMKQIEAAEKELGVKVKGNGKGHEPQGVSDAQLRTALGLLQQARAELKGKPLTHVDKAIKQITTALKIK